MNKPLKMNNAELISKPRVPQGHLFSSNDGSHLLVSDGSRIFGISEELALNFEHAMNLNDVQAFDSLLVKYGLDAPPFVTDTPPQSFPLRSISLAVAQKCNLGCTYCYAEGGDFGGPAKNMPEEIAFASIERLINGTLQGEQVNIAFLGGEPMINRKLIYSATKFAKDRAEKKNIKVGFSITTNGTLVTVNDGEFFEQNGFAVTISLDGVGEVHDGQRAFKGGQGSYARIIERIKPLLTMQHNMQVSARVTVTPRNLQLVETLDTLIDLGFHSVGFSPMLSSPTGKDEMNMPDLEVMLNQMIECGQEFVRKIKTGQRYPFSNIVNALREIHRGTHRPYPCGAGAGYMGVSADGGLFACHRFVDDEKGKMGDVNTGIGKEQQKAWLADRHVHFQEPCKSCWARYLCGGGCHHEVIHRGRPACDYIRGWLHFCLQTYVALLEETPEYFASKPN